MAAGSFDRLVQFRRATVQDDGFADVPVFTDHGDPVWAKRRDLSDAERWRGGEVTAMLTARFTVRHSPLTEGLTAKDRLTSDGSDFDIVGIKSVGGRERYFEITVAQRSD